MGNLRMIERTQDNGLSHHCRGSHHLGLTTTVLFIGHMLIVHTSSSVLLPRRLDGGCVLGVSEGRKVVRGTCRHFEF